MKKIKSLKDLAVDHPYYCSNSNYYSNDASVTLNTWKDFYTMYKNADVDMNLIFRWDLHLTEGYTDRYSMYIFIMHQRKGIFAPFIIKYVDETDLHEILEILNKHYEKIKELWEPLN